MLFALVLTFGPPAALLLLETILALVEPRLQRLAHLAAVAGLTALIVVQALKRSVGVSGTTALLLGAALGGALFALAYWRFALVRSFLTTLAPAALVFLFVFFFATPVERLLFPRKADAVTGELQARTPVVVVVFDEFPLNSLLGRGGRIDESRYPNFARLAAGSHWFRNTTTVSPWTTEAIPALLTGNKPLGDRFPIFSDYPRNLFTLLGRRYRLNVWETQTRLCPAGLCASTARDGAGERASSLASDVGILYLHLVSPPAVEFRLPSVTDSWFGFGENDTEEDGGVPAIRAKSYAQRHEEAFEGKYNRFWSGRAIGFRRFVESIEPTRAPVLHFVHTMLPHGPYHLFPSGRRSATPRAAPGLTRDRPQRWGEDRWLVMQAHQRHLLQVARVDRLLGYLVARLRAVRLYDRVLVVVVADHGVSFRPGDLKREVTDTNVADIAFVPFFVKLPGQRKGRVLDGHVELVDVLATIADGIDAEIPWRVEGRSAFEDTANDQTRVGDLTRSVAELNRKRKDALVEQIRTFGADDDGAGISAAGPYPELVGRPVERLRIEDAARDTAEVNEKQGRLLAQRGSDWVSLPSPLQGRITGPSAAPGRAIALALNGRIAAVSVTYFEHGDTRFSLLASESAFQAGRNDVDLFYARRTAGGLVLAPLEVAR